MQAAKDQCNISLYFVPLCRSGRGRWCGKTGTGPPPCGEGERYHCKGPDRLHDLPPWWPQLPPQPHRHTCEISALLECAVFIYRTCNNPLYTPDGSLVHFVCGVFRVMLISAMKCRALWLLHKVYYYLLMHSRYTVFTCVDDLKDISVAFYDFNHLFFSLQSGTMLFLISFSSLCSARVYRLRLWPISCCHLRQTSQLSQSLTKSVTSYPPLLIYMLTSFSIDRPPTGQYRTSHGTTS